MTQPNPMTDTVTVPREMENADVERMDELGFVTWASSDEDGGPDVGITVGLGPELGHLWLGEIARARFESEGCDQYADNDMGWWLMHYKPDDEPLVIGKLLSDDFAAREFFENTLAPLLRPLSARTDTAAAIEKHDEGHPHLIGGEFQSDKYPTCPRGKVPLSVKDKTAQDLLWEYAQRRRSVDAEFASDLEIALKSHGYTAAAGVGEDARSLKICRDGRDFVMDLAVTMGVVDMVTESITVNELMPRMLERAREDRERWHSPSTPTPREMALEEAAQVCDKLKEACGYSGTSDEKADNIIWGKRAAWGTAARDIRALSASPSPAARTGERGQVVDYEYRLAVSYQIVGALLDAVGAHDTDKGQAILDYLNGGDIDAPEPLSCNFSTAPTPPMTIDGGSVVAMPFTKHEHDAFAAICFTAMRMAKEFTPARQRLSFEDLRNMSKALADLMLNWQAERTARKEHLRQVYAIDGGPTEAQVERAARAMCANDQMVWEELRDEDPVYENRGDYLLKAKIALTAAFHPAPDDSGQKET